MKKVSLKRLHTVCFHLYDIMKKANYGDNKKQNQCYGRDWLWGKLSLAVVGRVMLSKSLIQFSADGWDCVPSCRPNHGRGNGFMDLCQHDAVPGLL